MKKYIILPIIGFTLILTGCKPTEKNYQDAYEKAYAAAQRRAAAEHESLEGLPVESMTDERMETVDGETFMVSDKRLKPVEADSVAPEGKYGVAVAHYSMSTNARMHLENLKKDFPEAFLAKDGAEHFYVIISRVAKMSDVPSIIRRFREKYPDFRYIGLHETPEVFTLTL